jgi:alpha-beta hydrolase superfamily lysophospholipase
MRSTQLNPKKSRLLSVTGVNQARIWCILGFLALSFAGVCPAQVDPELQKLEINNQNHLSYRKYLADNPRGVVLYLHGIQSHSGWYVQSCEILAENGYTVYAPDRRGSGLNRHDRGHVQNYEDLIADLDAFVAQMRADFPNLPVFLMSVSWGGKLALLYEAMRPGKVDGVILSTPGIRPQVDLPLWDKMRVFYYCWRRREIQPMIPVPIGRADMFTDDVEWQNWIEQDSLTLRRCTARFFWESNQVDKAIKKQISNCKAPFLLQLAGRDEIVNNRKTVKFLKRNLPGAETNRLEVIEYPEARHTLEFESDMREIVMDAVAWLNRWS